MLWKVVFACSLFLSLVHAQTLYTWVGGESCNTGNVWSFNSSSSCWFPPNIPSSVDSILFPYGSTTTLIGAYVTQQQPLNFNNFHTVYQTFGYSLITYYSEVLVEGTLFVNTSIVLSASAFNIYKGGAVIVQGNLAAITCSRALVVDGTLTMLQGIIMGTGTTTVSAGAMLNISSIPQIRTTEIYIMRNLDIYGTVSVNSGSIVHWGFWWQSQYLTFTIHPGGNFTLNGFFSKFFEGLYTAYPSPSALFPVSIYIYSSGVLQVNGRPELYHPQIINSGGVFVSNYYYYSAPCSENIFCYPYGLNYTDTITPVYSCSWDCLFPPCATSEETGTFLLETIPTYEVTNNWVLEAKSCEDILACRDSDSCATLNIDLSGFGTHLHCGEHLQFLGKTITFSNADEIVLADDLTFIDCSIITNNVILYFSREVHSLGSTFSTLESGEMVFIYLPTSGSDADAVSYTYYFTNQHFYWEDAFERIVFINSSLHGEMTFVSPVRIYGSSGLTIRSGSNIFVEREFKSMSFAGTGNLLIEKEAILTIGIEVGVFGDAILDVFGTLQVNGFSTVTSERLIRLHKGATLNIAGELSSNVDLSECSVGKDFITAISDRIIHC